jgi:glycosyltransferase involved in cell wall biosynthesis
MKVLHLAAGNIFGGIERGLVAYAAGRAAFPEMVPFFALNFPGHTEEELRLQGVDVTVMGPARFSSPASLAHARHSLKALLRGVRPDIVLTHGVWVHCVYAPVLETCRIKVGLALHAPPQFHWLDLLALDTRADLVITYSKFVLTQSRWWLRSKPAIVCTYPFRPMRKVDRAEERAKLGIEDGTALVIQVGRLDPYKGHRLHLKALAELKGEPGWRASFVGGAQPRKMAYARSLEKLSTNLGLADRVTFLGYRSDVSEVLAAADIFCHPNTGAEAFGMVFVEAMQAGLPVVATRMGGALEILGQGGGVLVHPDPRAVAGALRGLLRDSKTREEIGCCGKEIASRRFSLESGVRDIGAKLLAFLSHGALDTKADRWA